MSNPARITLRPVVTGDTWDGLTVAMTSDGTALAANLASVRMQWQTLDGTEALTLTSADNEITITDAAAWEFTVESVAITLDPSVYTIGIETTDADGTVKTRIKGSHEILADPVA